MSSTDVVLIQWNTIWMHGTAEQIEEACQMLWDTVDELNFPLAPLAKKETLSVQQGGELIQKIAERDPASCEKFQEVFSEITRAIEAARHRDITLI